MKKTIGIALVVSLLTLPALRAQAMSSDEAAAKSINFIDGLADIVDKDKDNCDKMADNLHKYLDDNAALIKELNEAKAKMTEADKKRLKDKYEARGKAAQQKMMGGMKCQKNEKVKAAFLRLRDASK